MGRLIAFSVARSSHQASNSFLGIATPRTTPLFAQRCMQACTRVSTNWLAPAKWQVKTSSARARLPWSNFSTKAPLMSKMALVKQQTRFQNSP
eukprot:COSAG01_NODE_81_length_27820_cov_22.659753_19_plen_93_part_00